MSRYTDRAPGFPMPILPAEPDLYPLTLWQDFSNAGGWASGRKWWCLHTKPRQEKAAARDLRTIKIPYYLPQVIHEDRTPQGRKTRSVIPLFTSYLFLLGDERERVLAMKGNRLVRVIDVLNQDALNHDLRQIHQMLASGLAVVPELTMPVGARVKILSGPLTGIEGRVIRRGKRDQFMAVVHFLGSGATVISKTGRLRKSVKTKKNPRGKFICTTPTVKAHRGGMSDGQMIDPIRHSPFSVPEGSNLTARSACGAAFLAAA